MSTISEKATPARERSTWTQALALDVWASIAIAVMWIAVAVSAVWGPNFVSSNGAGTNSTTIPSAVFVAGFAALGSWAVAKYAFRRPESGTN
jgi:hypothetical protein